jgi:hypothetical protein
VNSSDRSSKEIISYCLAYQGITPLSSHRSTSLVGVGLHYEVPRSHSNTPHSVVFLYTSDRPVTETCTWQYTTITRDRHLGGGIRTRYPSKRSAVDPCLIRRGHWDLHPLPFKESKCTLPYSPKNTSCPYPQPETSSDTSHAMTPRNIWILCFHLCTYFPAISSFWFYDYKFEHF